MSFLANLSDFWRINPPPHPENARKLVFTPRSIYSIPSPTFLAQKTKLNPTGAPRILKKPKRQKSGIFMVRRTAILALKWTEKINLVKKRPNYDKKHIYVPPALISSVKSLIWEEKLLFSWDFHKKLALKSLFWPFKKNVGFRGCNSWKTRKIIIFCIFYVIHT